MNARPIASVVFTIGLLTMLLACSPDPCSYGNDLPTCQAGKVVAQQTIAVSEATRQAVDRASAMRATQDAIALRAQGTQGAINSQATSIAVEQAATRGAESVQAQATRQAVELEALRNSIVMSATQSAMVIDATRQAISADATKTAIDGEIRVVQADVQKSVAGLQAGIVLVGITGLFVAGIVMLIWYGRRLAQAGVHGVEVRTSIVRYGPNNSHWALVSPGNDGQKNVLLTDSMIGPHSLSNGALSTLHQLSVPDQVKLLALIEQEKRAKLVLAAQAVGSLPTATIERVTTAADQTPITAQITSSAGGHGLPVTPSFMNLITAWHPSPVQMMLGYGSSGPIYGSMEDMLSIGVVGRPKTGKTTILRFIYAQCVIVGAQVVVWDMHRNIVKDLPGANAYTQLTAIEHWRR